MAQISATGLLVYLLRPVARFCLRNAIKIQDFERVFKQVLAETAIDELQKSGQSHSVSKVSVMTGIARKLVPTAIAPTDSNISFLAKLISLWQADKRFSSSSGKPKLLSFQGTESDFFKLVQKTSLDLDPYAVLFELERIGLVKKNENTVQLKGQQAITNDKKQIFALAGDDFNSLLSTVEENVKTAEPLERHLHLSTFYDNIPDAGIEKVREWILIEGSKFHARARFFIAKWDKDLNSDREKLPGRNQLRICSHSFIESQEKESKGIK